MNIFLWNKGFIRKINQVSFPSDVGDFFYVTRFKIGSTYIQLTKNAIKLNMSILLWEE